MATWNELVYEVYSGLIVLVLTVDASRFSAAVTDCMFVTFCAGLYVPIKYQPLGYVGGRIFTARRNAMQCSHCKRCTSHSNSFCLSVCPSVCHTPVLCQNSQRQSYSAINCLSSGINIMAGGSSFPLISERKGTDPHWKHLRCTHFAS